MTAQFRDFAVLGELGSGRYGRVWRAEGPIPGRHGQPGRRRQVAIKTLQQDTPPHALEALRQEWALLDQVKHRAVVRVYAWLPEDRAVVMEYVHGVTLRTVLDTCRRKREQIYTEAALDLACELSDALYHAYTTPGDNGEPLNLVHRDLKPENIMLTPSGEVRILDFGLARVRNADFPEERDGLVRGTPVYMAPEQIRGDLIDHRTDLFALGLILFEMLTGQPAWALPPGKEADPAAVEALLTRISKGDLANECREIETLYPGTGTIVARLLQPNPRNRYVTGQDVLVDLRRQMYRDQGASLKEFCDVYFGSLHPLPDPAADGASPMADPTSRPPAPPPSSPTDAGDGSGVPRAVPVKRPQRSVPMAVPSAAPVVPADAAPRPAPKIVQRPSPQRPDPIQPDDVPQSVRRSSGTSGSGNRIVGERRPDETGMLPIVPLSTTSDKAGAAADPSATSFFAIPAPRAPRAGAPVGGGPGNFQPPPVAATNAAPPPAAAQPGRGGGGVAGYGAVAGYGGAATAANTPFLVAGPSPASGGSADSRVQSQRVWVLMLVMAMLAGMAVLSVVAIVLYTNYAGGLGGTTTTQNAPLVPAPPAAPTCTTGQILVDNACVSDRKDCGDGVTVSYYDVCPAPKAVTTSRCPAGTRWYGGKCVDPATIPAAPPPTTTAPVAARAPLTVTFNGDPLPTSATLQCGEDKLRGTVSGAKVTFADVPTSGNCTLRPSSAMTYTPAKGLHGGKNYSCSVVNYQTNCN